MYQVKKKYLFLCLSLFVFIFSFVGCSKDKNPKESFDAFVKALEEGGYSSMYSQLSSETKKSIDEKYFVDTYKNIYGNAKVSKVSVSPQYPEKLKDDGNGMLRFPANITIDTPAGTKQFTYEVNLVKEKVGKTKEWFIVWDEKMVFPELEKGDKVVYEKQIGKRGEIKDRNGVSLAANTEAVTIYVVPQEIAPERDKTIAHLAETLGMTVEQINAILNQQWVKNNPAQGVPIMDVARDEMPKIIKAQEPKGVKGQAASKLLRRYPAGTAAAHLIGYIGKINAEELKTLQAQGYDENDYIGRDGLEKVFESRLKGEIGGTIYTADSKGKKKSTVLKKEPKNGENIALTIDINMQKDIYSQFGEDSGTSVAVHPKTGEVLAMVSSPSYDPNKFVSGISSKEYKDLESNPKKPFLRRYENAIVPGSVFKPITAAIGLKTGKLNPAAEIKIQGNSWQRDASWGKYSITRVSSEDESVNLLDAFVRSDNIYFAQTALAITKDAFLSGVKEFGIGDKIPFSLGLSQSQVGKLEKDVELADSGYGQDKILMNPLHLALIYSSFVNEGNIMAPILEMKDKTDSLKVWKEKVISKEIADTIVNDLVQVVENQKGTAHEAQIPGLSYAGKTGTAEIKKSQDDTTGTENGWYAAVNVNNPKVAIVMMIEDVKGRGGSHYLLPKVKNILSKYGK
nr:penicillin-binding transpeptidase domain-containing protein [Clostridium swellfunianum]